MKKHTLILLISIILLPSLADAQRWKRFRRQFIFGVGVTNFLGDLGGANQIGRDFIYDLDFAATRPSLLVGYRYQLNSYFFLRGNAQWGILRGDDSFTRETFRQGRNLHFRSGFLEANVMGEFYLLQNSRGNLYRLRGVRGRSGLKIDLFVFGGIGFMYFNPKAEYQGTWVKLQPLGTEGQGLPGEKEKYRRTTFTVPYGIGIGKSIDRYWQINVELTMRFTFTDYIDDVSDTYYGKQRLYDAYISRGASEAEAIRVSELSDRNVYYQVLPDSRFTKDSPVEPGGQRGDVTDKDSFMTGMIMVSRKIVKRRRSRPKF